MKLHRLLPALLLSAFTIPVCGQARPLSEVDSLLNAASKALDHRQQLAPDIHCEDATQTQFRDACKIDVLAMGERVQEAKRREDCAASSANRSPGRRFVRCLPGVFEEFWKLLKI